MTEKKEPEYDRGEKKQKECAKKEKEKECAKKENKKGNKKKRKEKKRIRRE